MKTLYKFLSLKPPLSFRLFFKSTLSFYSKSMNWIDYCFCGLFLTFFSCAPTPKSKVNVEIQLSKSYVTPFTNDKITVDGKDDEAAWITTEWTDFFIDIEGVKTPKFETQIKMLWDETHLYFFSKMKDPHVWGNLKQRDTIIFYNNDFEIFIDLMETPLETYK